MVADTSKDFSTASSSEPDADRIWNKVQDALNSPAVQAAARVTTASHFFGCAPEDLSASEFASDIKAPSVMAFIKTRNKVFALTRDTPAYDYDKNGDAVLISLVHLADEDQVQRKTGTSQFAAGCVILADFPADKALEVMSIAEENGWLPRLLPGDQDPVNAIKALRQEILPPVASANEPEAFRNDKT